jgi:nicotinate dehydrogenase subunit B
MKPINPFKLQGAEPLPEKAFEALDRLGASRRDFLKTAGVMMVGFGAAATSAKAQSIINPSGTTDISQLDSWLAIGADESVTVLAGKHEHGQGIRTLQLQLAAEELSVSMDRITLLIGISGVTPNQFLTVGSLSTMTQFGPFGAFGSLRVALDTARDALLTLASQYLDTDVSDLTITNGVVSSKSDPSASVSYGNLVYGQRFNLKINPNAVPNDPSTWKVIGKSVPRVEIPAKAKGAFTYVQKVRIPGMLHGKVVRPPTLNAHVQSIDKSTVGGLPGSPQVVQVNDFVGVVADTEWNAQKAATALAAGITWSAGDPVPFDQAGLYTYMAQQPSADAYQVNTGDVDKVMATATKTIAAQYLYPFQMHGALASSGAVADVRGGTGKNATVKVWSATQGVYNCQNVLAALLGIPAGNIQVYFIEGSGGYGHNGVDPATYDAALLSQAVGKPVRLQYSRRDEMTAGESYGHPTVANEKIGLDNNGSIIAWDYEAFRMQRGEGAIGFTAASATPGNSISGALAGFPTTKVVPTTTPTAATAGSAGNGSNFIPPYVTSSVNGVSYGTGKVASQRVLTRVVASPFFTAWLRSPDRLQNTWAHESVMDEVAASLMVDPVQYRMRHLADPRLINVLNTVARAANWDTRPSPKPGNARTGIVTGRGVACVVYEGANGYCALVAEVRVDQDKGIITVTKVTAGTDTGPVINPNGLRNQMEGQVIQGISRTLVEEVKFRNQSNGSGFITSGDWISYPVLSFGNPLPQIETILINNLKVLPTGAGETILTIVAAGIGNAVFDATGVRMRQIPLTPANFLAAKTAQKV